MPVPLNAQCQDTGFVSLGLMMNLGTDLFSLQLNRGPASTCVLVIAFPMSRSLLSAVAYPLLPRCSETGRVSLSKCNLKILNRFVPLGSVFILQSTVFGSLSKAAWKSAIFVLFCLHIRN